MNDLDEVTRKQAVVDNLRRAASSPDQKRTVDDLGKRVARISDTLLKAKADLGAETILGAMRDDAAAQASAAAIGSLIGGARKYFPDDSRVITDDELGAALLKLTSSDPNTFAPGSTGDVCRRAVLMIKDLLTIAEGGSFKLQKAAGPAMHRLRDSFHSNNVIAPAVLSTMPAPLARQLEQPTHAFLIQHDWAGAFAKASGDDIGEVALPYKSVTFELHVSGRRVCVVCYDEPDIPSGTDILLLPFVETQHGWAFHGLARTRNGEIALIQHKMEASRHTNAYIKALGELIRFCWSHIRAALIALDAEVAVSTIERAPHKLNHQRMRRGKAPIADYHLVSLARRSRPPALETPANDTPRNSPRLHFRRSHWRHFENSKTRIPWMLVGDPDLGFIDKDYRL